MTFCNPDKTNAPFRQKYARKGGCLFKKQNFAGGCCLKAARHFALCRAALRECRAILSEWRASLVRTAVLKMSAADDGVLP
jgi:hypothetical protein